MNKMKERTTLMEWIEQLLKNKNPLALQHHPGATVTAKRRDAVCRGPTKLQQRSV